MTVMLGFIEPTTLMQARQLDFTAEPLNFLCVCSSINIFQESLYFFVTLV
jgi:hypothetical protein